LSNLLTQIENKRKELEILAAAHHYDFANKEVLKVSGELDDILNRHKELVGESVGQNRSATADVKSSKNFRRKE
jgi:hypothetical protein